MQIHLPLSIFCSNKEIHGKNIKIQLLCLRLGYKQIKRYMEMHKDTTALSQIEIQTNKEIHGKT